jgi:copper chaperone CopZ
MRLFGSSEKKTGNYYKTLKLKVSGMHCEGCAKSIQESLSKINGIRNIQANFQDKEVLMEFNGNKVTLEKIRGAIRKTGLIPGVEQIDSEY